METDLFDPIPDVKLYNETSIRIGTFIGGPLITGYLLAENFKKSGQPDKIRTTWLYAIIITILLFLAIFLIPHMDFLPNYVLPIIYSIIASTVLQKYQANFVKSHID